MKYSKYILFFVLIMLVASTKTLADDNWNKSETCYYMTNKFKAKLIVRTGEAYSGFLNTNNDYTSV